MSGLVWLASYPKSGNTWLRLILANLSAHDDRPVDINSMNLGGRYLVDRAVIDEETFIDSDLLTLDEVDRLRPILARSLASDLAARQVDGFVKVHDAYRWLDDGRPLLGRNTARAAVYLVRDPRDVAVSFAAHMGHPVEVAVGRLCENSCMGMNRGGHSPQVRQCLLDWSGHVRSWTRQDELPTIVCRYEDLRADTVAAVTRILAFLGIPASSEAVSRAVRFADFAELRRQEELYGFVERNPASTTPFFRAGRVGGWVDVLTAAQVDAIVNWHCEIMTEFGYL